jgi:D-alanyl-D-alanine carboxypeptidase
MLSGNGENRFSARNTNRETGKFPLLLASKTGYTDLAGGNLALAFDAGFNHPIVVVVLGSSYDGRFADAEKLVWSTLEYLQSR